MKKVMIGIIILIPIIIVLVVSLVSTFVSTRTHIGVEEVLMDKHSVELGLTDAVLDLNDFVSVNVLPERASNKDYAWSIADIECLDEDYENRRHEYVQNKDNAEYNGEIVHPAVSLVDKNGNEIESSTTGLIKVNAYCSFSAVAQAETKSARCTFFVVGYEVERVTLSAPSTLKVGESKLLDVTYSPIDSIVTDCIWSSSDDSILTVDKNGVIHAVAEGSAEVKMRAKVYEKDSYVESAGVTINVESNLTKYGSEVCIGENSVLLSKLGLTASDITDLNNCTADGETLTVTDNSVPATFKVGGETVTISVVGEGVKIVASDIFSFDESSADNFILAVGNNLTLSVDWLSDLKSEAINADSIVWSSSVSAVASIENGVVTGKTSGKTMVTASYGSYTSSILLAVENKVTNLTLAITDSILADSGIARETVFASMNYVAQNDPESHTVVNNKLEIGFSRPFAPTDAVEASAFYQAFNFVVTENGEPTDKAFFEENVLVFDSTKISGRTTLTVTVSAKYPKYKTNARYTTSTFHVNVVDGIEVNSYAEMKKAANDKYVICLANDISMMDGNTDFLPGWNAGTVYVSKSIYGNGHAFKAAFRQIDGSSRMIQVEGDNVVVSNITIRANEVGEEISSADDNLGLTGYCICFDSPNPEIALTNCRLEYSILENASSCVGSYGTNLEIEGCIMRNTQGTGIYVPTYYNSTYSEYSIVTITNCVMSNLIGTGCSFHYNGFSGSDPETVKRAEDCVAAGKNTKLIQKGFLDIYNWQQTNTLTLISPETVSSDLYAVIQFANSFIADNIETNEVFDDYVSIYQGKKYFHLGFISTGLTEKSYLETSFEDKRFVEINSDLFGIELGNPVRLFTYGNNDKEISPGQTYTVNKKLIERLHGN